MNYRKKNAIFIGQQDYWAKSNFAYNMIREIKPDQDQLLWGLVIKQKY